MSNKPVGSPDTLIAAAGTSGTGAFARVGSPSIATPTITGGAITMSDAAAGGIKGFGRAVIDGVWTQRAFAAGNFTGNGAMTWTVAAGDLTTDAHMYVGKTMFYSFEIATSTIGGTPNSALQILIPDGKTAARQQWNTIMASDNGVVLAEAAVFSVTGSTFLFLRRSDAGGNWTASTDLTRVRGQIAFEIQ